MQAARPNSGHWFAALALAAVLIIIAIASSGREAPDQSSLGDLARKARAEKNSKDHVAATRVLDDETRPRSNWRKLTNSYWATIPPSTLSVMVPPTTQPTLTAQPPYPKAAIVMGETICSESFNQAAREYLTMLLTRSQYSGAKLVIDGVEDTSVGGQDAILIHFNFDFRGIPHQGVALFVSAPLQIMSMGCIYRKQDWQEAATICEDVVNSAEVQIPTEYKPFKKPFQY